MGDFFIDMLCIEDEILNVYIISQKGAKAIEKTPIERLAFFLCTLFDKHILQAYI